MPPHAAGRKRWFPAAQARCAEEEPQMRQMRPDHFVACHFPVETPVTLTGVSASSSST